MHPRLYLITPPKFELDTFAEQLRAALQGGDVASLLLSMPEANESELQAAAKVLVPIAQEAGCAVLVENNTQVTGRSGADGLHISKDQELLEATIRTFDEDRIIGFGGVKTRHDAMVVASMGIDYIFFGMLELNQEPEPHKKSIDFGNWWAEVFETPCVVLAGTHIDSIATTAQTGAEFIAVREAVWDHSGGPEQAVAQINAVLQTYTLAEVED